MVGFSLSVIITSNEHTSFNPEASVTVYSRVFVPTGNISPVVSPVPSVWSVVEPLQLSVPIGSV